MKHYLTWVLLWGNMIAGAYAAPRTVEPVTLSRSHPFILDATISGKSANWRITDRSTHPLRDGYEFWYLINNDLVKTNAPLNNYHYESDAPIRVHKQIFRIGTPVMAWWVFNGWKEGDWGSPDASYVIDRADIGGASYFMFKESHPLKAKPRELNWMNPIPPFWKPALTSTWPVVSPEFSLPKRKMYVHTPKVEGQTIKQTMTRGVTHYSHRWQNDEPDLPKDRLYNDVPRPENFFDLHNEEPPGNLTEDVARQRGREVFLPHLWIGETIEGRCYMEPGHANWGYFYDEVVKRMEARKAQDGMPYYIAHNYYSIMGSLSFVNQKGSDLMFVYDQPVDEWAQRILPDTLRRYCNLHVQGWYKSYPDDRNFVYQQLFQMEAATGLGLTSGIFLFPVHEYLPGFSNLIELEKPAGRFTGSDKAPLSPSELIMAPFLAFEYGDIYVVWDTDYKRSGDPSNIHKNPIKGESDWWEPEEGGRPTYPYTSGSGQGFPATYAQWTYDMTHWGVLLYQRTKAAFDGKRQYAPFRIDKGPWIEPQSNGSDILHAWDAERGIASIRIKGKNACIWYLNPYADNRQHTIEIRHPTKRNLTWKGTVAGDGIHVAMVKW